MAKLLEDQVEFEGSLPQGERLTFQLKSSPKMFAMLSDGIYTDKIMAVIRELSCNAYDSAAMAKKADPAGDYHFTVNVPTQLDSNFWVEDVGLGIDPDKIVEIFWTYGASTKTNTNDAIGALGLGSKSPFAYTKSSFLVINRYNGIEYKYFCFINEGGVPDGKLVFQGATDQPNGVRVELAVRTGDIRSFRERIIRFYSFWDQAKLPRFTGDTSVTAAIIKRRDTIKVKGSNWELRTTDYESDLGTDPIAVMGGVPYRINKGALPPSTPNRVRVVLGQPLNLHFGIGDLSFQVSREELSYDEPTIAALTKVATQVADELLANARKDLQDLATPNEFLRKFNEREKQLRSTFPFIADELVKENFKLADGRKFNGRELRNARITYRAKEHARYNVTRIFSDQRQYVKGLQHYGLDGEMNVDLVKPGVIDPKTQKLGPEQTATLSWFAAGVKPAPWINVSRKRTPGNFIHDGYKVTTSWMNLHACAETVFIINDIGERGAEGMRFYNGGMQNSLGDAYRAESLFFVDGFSSNADVATLTDEITKFVKGTGAEGCPILLLSALPGFKLPEAPKKTVTAAPRSAPQRGMIEQRFRTYYFSKAPAVVSKYGELEFAFARGTAINTDYERQSVKEPMLYVETVWGNPANDALKQLTTKESMGALVELGLLDRFIKQPTTTGQNPYFKLAMLSPTQVVEAERKGVELINVASLFKKVQELLAADKELIKAFQEAPNEDDSSSNILRRYLNSSGFVKHGLPHLKADNVLLKLQRGNKALAAFFKASPARAALCHLVFNVNEFIMQRELLESKVSLDKALKTYPLLNDLYNLYSKSPRHYEHIAAYMNMVDAMAEAAAAEAKLKEQEKLHAEAILSA